MKARTIAVTLIALTVGSASLADDPAPAELTNALGMEFVRIPTGRFKDAAGKMQTIDQVFYIAKTEVTLAQFRQFKPNHDNGHTKWGRNLDYDPLPAVNVPLNEAKGFCKWLGEQDGGAYRLPTASEWEYACRARSVSRYFFGDDNFELKHYAWYDDNASGLGVRKEDRGPRPVGQKLPNAWNLFDMHGNVAEWCQDPTRPISLGGGWKSCASECTFKGSREANVSGELYTGFRVVLTRLPRDDNYGRTRWSRVGRRAVEQLLNATTLPADACVLVVPMYSPNGGTWQVGILLADGIETALANSGRYTVIGRSQLDRILAERNLSFADLTEARTSVAVARTLGADAAITGSVQGPPTTVRCTVRLIDAADWGTLSTTTLEIPKDAEVTASLFYVQRPANLHAGASCELPPLVLSYHIFGQRELPGGRFEEVVVRDGSMLRSYEQYRVNVQASSDCYFYLITYDSLGAVYVLFPREEIKMSNYLRGGVSYTIPGEDDPWYTLDDNTGTETMILIASYEPLNRLDELVAQMARAGGSETGDQIRQEVEQLASAAGSETGDGKYRIANERGRERGTVLRRPKAIGRLTSGQTVQRLMSIAEGRSRVAKTIRFKHER